MTEVAGINGVLKICVNGVDTELGAGGTGGSVGELNTASNVGTAGIGLFKQKTGVDLEFKNINVASAKLTINDDTGNNEVDLDLGSVAASDLSDGTTGSGAIVLATSPTITTPTLVVPIIAATHWVAAQHQHVNTITGGQLTDAALSAAVGIAKGGSGETTAQAAIDALTQVSGATDEHVLTKDTATGNAIYKAAAGGAAGQTILSRFKALSYDAGSATPERFGTDQFQEWAALTFDDTVTETAIFSDVLDDSYGGGGLTVDIYYAMQNDTTGNVKLNVSIGRNNVGQNILAGDEFAAANTVTDTIPGTTGDIAKATITFTDGADMDSLAAGEPYRLEFSRDITAADTASNDLLLLWVVVSET